MKFSFHCVWLETDKCHFATTEEWTHLVGVSAPWRLQASKFRCFTKKTCNKKTTTTWLCILWIDQWFPLHHQMHFSSHTFTHLLPSYDSWRLSSSHNTLLFSLKCEVFDPYLSLSLLWVIILVFFYWSVPCRSQIWHSMAPLPPMAFHMIFWPIDASLLSVTDYEFADSQQKGLATSHGFQSKLWVMALCRLPVSQFIICSWQ